MMIVCNDFGLCNFIVIKLEITRLKMKRRFAGSYFNIFWPVLAPLLTAVVLAFVFSVLMAGRMGQRWRVTSRDRRGCSALRDGQAGSFQNQTLVAQDDRFRVITFPTFGTEPVGWLQLNDAHPRLATGLLALSVDHSYAPTCASTSHRAISRSRVGGQRARRGVSLPGPNLPTGFQSSAKGGAPYANS